MLLLSIELKHVRRRPTKLVPSLPSVEFITKYAVESRKSQLKPTISSFKEYKYLKN